eukprot:gene6219-11629_t
MAGGEGHFDGKDKSVGSWQLLRTKNGEDDDRVGRTIVMRKNCACGEDDDADDDVEGENQYLEG